MYNCFSELLRNVLTERGIEGHRRDIRVQKAQSHLSAYISDLHKKPANRAQRFAPTAAEEE